jgi:hypothetical protein
VPQSASHSHHGGNPPHNGVKRVQVPRNVKLWFGLWPPNEPQSGDIKERQQICYFRLTAFAIFFRKKRGNLLAHISS